MRVHHCTVGLSTCACCAGDAVSLMLCAQELSHSVARFGVGAMERTVVYTITEYLREGDNSRASECA